MPNLTKLIKHVRFFISTFVDKELTLFAASLSYYTIFAIIPIVLIVLTLLTFLPTFSQHYETIKVFIFSNIMPVTSETIIGHIDGFLVNSAKMGFIGIVMILLASVLFFNNFEHITNKIFHAKPRGIFKFLRAYFGMFILILSALGISFFIRAEFGAIDLVGYIIVWVLFFLIFQFTPNAKVRLKASLISSFVVAIVFTLSKNVFIEYVLYTKSYTTIYGSFAILMFLFLWIYISWIIFIYGLKLCYMINRIYKKTEAKGK